MQIAIFCPAQRSVRKGRKGQMAVLQVSS